jgi:hypothetical protein
MLLGALKRSPGRERLLLILAKVVDRGGDSSSAGWLLQLIVSSGTKDTQTRVLASELLNRLKPAAERKIDLGESLVRESGEVREQSLQVRLATIKDARKSKPRDPREEKYVRGILTRVDCAKGITLYLLVGTPPLPQDPPSDQRIENLHTDSSASLQWVTETGTEITTLQCGKQSQPVSVTYIPQRQGLRMGAPLIVQFLSIID